MNSDSSVLRESLTPMAILIDKYDFYFDDTKLTNIADIPSLSYQKITIKEKDTTNVVTGVLNTKLVTLFEKLKENHSELMNTETTTNSSVVKEVYDYVVLENNAVNFSADLALNNDIHDDRKTFNKEKNRLITMMAKNQNIYHKLWRKRFMYYVFLFLMILYITGMSYIYMKGSSDDLDRKTAYILLISISLVVIFIFTIVDIYQIFTRKNYETFELKENPTLSDLSSEVETYLVKLPIMIEYDGALRDDSNNRKSEIIHSILHDFNNMNYVNMRKYQITDYKINESRNRTHFMKYGFLVISLIGLLAGLYLRSFEDSSGFVVSREMFIGGSVLLVTSYMLIFVLHQRQNMIRKKYNWNKLYWNIKSVHEKQ